MNVIIRFVWTFLVLNEQLIHDKTVCFTIVIIYCITLFFLFQRVSITWLRQRESEKNVLCPQRGWGRGIGASRTWNSLEGLASKYYSGPLLLNFRVRMETGISNMVNPLTIKLFITLYPGLSKFIFIFRKKNQPQFNFCKTLTKVEKNWELQTFLKLEILDKNGSKFDWKP